MNELKIKYLLRLVSISSNVQLQFFNEWNSIVCWSMLMNFWWFLSLEIEFSCFIETDHIWEFYWADIVLILWVLRILLEDVYDFIGISDAVTIQSWATRNCWKKSGLLNEVGLLLLNYLTMYVTCQNFQDIHEAIKWTVKAMSFIY